jgi:thiamine kinase-like enzyme
MTPETALTTIPGFTHARMGIVLADGPTNKTVLLDFFDAKYVLRVDKPTVAELGLDRIAEEEICRMVAAAGLAPEPVYYDHANGVSLRRFVPGTNWLESDLRSTSSLKKLAGLLRNMHNLPAVNAEFKPGAAVDRYAEQLGTDEARQIAHKARDLLAETRQLQDRTCLCHNDLLNHNILDSNRVMLIDWEFAGMGDPYFDLAVVVQHHALGEKLGRQFLTAYLARKPNDAEQERLAKNCAFYAALLELWLLRIKQI